MSERNIGLEILEGLQEIKQFKAGETELKTRILSEPKHPKMIREKLSISQATFAALMGVSIRTIQDWEQGRREPSGPAKSLLRIADQHPNVFLQLV